MSRAERAAEWIYHGLWGVLVEWFRVPDRPPTLPVRQGEYINSFQPARGFLQYLKFWFWVALLAVDIALSAAYIAAAIALWQAGYAWIALLLLPVALFIIIAPDIVAYVAIHLRYDTTWYVMTDRSLRIRRGIWSIHETTITFENVQNMKVQQGPLQRHFGIADLLVETAGAGGEGHNKSDMGVSNRGVIEGIANAPEIRERILMRLRESPGAGLGDDSPDAESRQPSITAAHLQALREVREEVRALAGPAA